MNGDVGKDSTGDYSPMADNIDNDASAVSNNELEELQATGSNGSEMDSVDSGCMERVIPGSDSVSKTILADNLVPKMGSEQAELDSENMEQEVIESDSKEHLSSPNTKVETSMDEESTPVELPQSKNTDSSGDIAQVEDKYIVNDDTGQENIKEEGDCVVSNSDEASLADLKTQSRDQIKQQVSQQVEFFFSRENWSSDRYLLSQMDSDQYVPIYILASCSQFKSITKDHSIILEALKESLFVQLDEENNRVRPNYKRCIVILREIPKSTPVEQIEAMFEGEGCPKAVSCEFVHNDTWYVTFESDSDAQKAYRYLRETVKTFNDKPILARIKTKPMSRIGCLSVLPSYGGKSGGGEQRDNPVPPPPGAGPSSGPHVPSVGPGIPGVPNQHPTPSAYPPPNPQRVYFPQNSMNSYNYNYPGSQVPAYFYPSPMMQWPNFYDFNGLIHYNGLSPRVTYKPPPNTRYNSNNNNNNRRNKNRENNKFDKTDPRHVNSLSSNVGPRHNGPGSRPQSAHSPHPTVNHLGQPNMNSHHSYASQPSSISAADNGSSHYNPKSSSSGSSTPNNNNGNGSIAGLSSTNFAQSDFALPSHHSTSYAPLAYSSSSTGASGTSTPSMAIPSKNEKKDKIDLTVNAPPFESSLNNEGICSVAETTPPNSSEPIKSTYSSSTSISSHSTSVSNVSTHSSASVSQPVYTHHNQGIPPPHRSMNYNNEGHPASRDAQPQRQMSRGGRRRITRRDEDINGHPGSGMNGRGMQRGNQEMHSRAPYNEVRKPQFELQSNSFPPLPSADEVPTYIPEEKVQESTSQTAWSGETHKFSDIMKGTAKPKQANSSFPTENKESVSQDASPALQPSTSIIVSVPIESKSVQQSSSTSTSQPVNINQDISTTSSVAGSSSSKSSLEDAVVNVSQASQSGGRHDRQPQQVREQRVVREERRGAASSNPPVASVRRERDYIPGIGRGAHRRDTKENRSAQNRFWREDRPDPDGWITKAPRETRNNRDHRYQQPTHQHSYYEANRNSCNTTKPSVIIPNGDSSPPASPKLSESELKPVGSSNNTTPPKVSSNNTKNITVVPEKLKEDNTVERDKSTLNNNAGEHKLTWAKMAFASKDEMEKLSAELKEKEEQERLKKNRTAARPPLKLSADRPAVGREREGKQFRRENIPAKERERDRDIMDRPREFRGPDSGRGNSLGMRNKDILRPKSPK